MRMGRAVSLDANSPGEDDVAWLSCSAGTIHPLSAEAKVVSKHFLGSSEQGVDWSAYPSLPAVNFERLQSTLERIGKALVETGTNELDAAGEYDEFHLF